jgi:hypothetical protein
MLAASLALSAFGVAHANNIVKPNSHGSKGDFTASDEGKSSTPVPPVPVATAEKASGSDARLADRVTKALNSETSLKGSKIKVMASNGNVTLSGSVARQAQSDKAQRLAASKDMKGKVTNDLSSTG